MSLKMWYLKHFDKDRLLDELSKPAEGEYVVIRDGPNTSVRVPVEELDGYINYLKDKAAICMDEYKKYNKERKSGDSVRLGDEI